MAKTTKGRVTISANARESLTLAKNVYTKHLADGATSVLLALDGLNWAVTGPKIGLCLAKHEEAETLSRQL